MKKANNKQVAKISIFITSIFVIFLSVTYAFINLTLVGTKKQVITSGNLELELQEDENNLTITNALPMYDEVGMVQDPFTFRLVNKTANDTNYVVKLEDFTTGTALALSDVKYGLEKDGSKTINFLSTLTDNVIDSGTISGNQTINYTLRLWIKDSVTDNSVINGKSLSYRIDVDVSQQMLDDTGCPILVDNAPNVPELTSGMISVTYDETAKTWKKADTSSKWYDYSNQMWANAVTVTENNRATYMSAEPGTAIPMSDINTMWVWIPRYSYSIYQTTGRTEQKCSDLGKITIDSPSTCYKLGPTSLIEDALNVCKDRYPDSNIETEEDCIKGFKNEGAPFNSFKEIVNWMIGNGSLQGSMMVEEEYSNNIINGTSTLPGAIDIKFISSNQKDNGTGKCEKCADNWTTPEGFTFGDEDLSGLWVGKFETSTLEACTATNDSIKTDCDLTTLTPQIKPNVTSWRGARVSTFFTASRTMQDGKANVYGFDSASQTLDTHMLKNSEWGIVAMLSQSKYGKYGNPNYIGTNKEVYQNKSNTYITGMSNGTPGQSTTNTQVSYDTPDTGYGASTTGTIYGVYDMSGGAGNFVMGNYNNISGNSLSNNSGFCGTNGPASGCVEWPEAKYFDLYTSTTALTGYKQGDATYEVSGWYHDFAYFVYSDFPWFVRGGYYDGSVDAGVFDFRYLYGEANDRTGSRLALKP